MVVVVLDVLAFFKVGHFLQDAQHASEQVSTDAKDCQVLVNLCSHDHSFHFSTHKMDQNGTLIL